MRGRGCRSSNRAGCPVDPIVVEVPAAFKAVAVCLQQLLALAEAARTQAATDAPLPYADLEGAFAVGAGELQRALHHPVLTAAARDDRRLMIGGVLHSRVLEATTTFHTLTGDVPVTRWLYRPLGAAGGPCVDPVAVRGTWLPATAAAMAFLVQQAPVRDAEATARELHVLPYSDTSFHRVTRAVGARYATHRDAIEEALIARYRIPAAATGLTVSLDRVATPMEEPRTRPRGRPKQGAAKRPVTRAWRMAYCATVSLHEANGRTLHTLRYGATAGSDPAAVVLALVGDVTALRAQRPDLQVGVLCDGAAEMWNLLGAHFNPTALEVAVRELVDLWHLLEKVGKALRVRYREARTAQELHRWKLRLLNTSIAARSLRDDLRRWLAVP